MKNLKLGIKLGGGFALTALIVLFVGLVGIFQLEDLHHHEQELANNRMPAVKEIMQIKAESAVIGGMMRSLLTPYATVQQREKTVADLATIRASYGEVLVDFQKLPFAEEVESE
ncbi:MCP four helix bundle domain-containing protein [Desulfotalea psychrophila]|nr:MCP four helix bundle domain-containing protein [Desulfotalea psychrophila]